MRMSFVAMSFALCLPLFLSAAEVRTVKNSSGKWELLVDGRPFVIKGATKNAIDDLAVKSGVNTVRTYWSYYGTDQFAEFEKSGMMVICGLAIQKDGKKFDYRNPLHLEKQRKYILLQVRTFKNSPVLLIWGLGNETEGFSSKTLNSAYWNELELLAKLIKREDPGHPVMNTIAGNSPWKLKAIKKYAPSIDIIGINAYKEAGLSPGRVTESECDRPFILTEYGPDGHWQVPKTKWGAPIEPNPEEKAQGYIKSFRDVTGTKNCLGAVCFAWGQKQEVTGTWFGMFLESGEKTAAVDAVSMLYAGKYPENRVPVIRRIKSELDCQVVQPGSLFNVEALVSDPENDVLTYEWKVIRESGVRWAEGDAEAIPPTMANCFPNGNSSGKITVRTPDKPGAYRLFLFVRDGRGGGASHNIPFLIKKYQKQ